MAWPAAAAATTVWNSLLHTITDDLNNTSLYQFLNPDLELSSTEGPISINSVTLSSTAIHLTGWHMACFLSLFPYLLTYLHASKYENEYEYEDDDDDYYYY